MKTKKLLSTLLSAVMAVIVLASCGGAKNYSAEAAKAANAAQNTVVFETDTVLAKSLQNALKDHTQTSDVKAAMAADRDLKDLLTSGHQLDVFAMRADNAQAAAEAIAEKVAALVAGKMDEGKIAMVLADNGYYYAAVLTYRSVNNSNGGDNDEPPALPDVTGIVIATNEGGSVEIIEGQDVKIALQNMRVTIQYSDGTSETITNYEVSPSTFGEDELGTQKLTITFTGKNGQKVSVNVDVTVVAKQVKTIQVTAQPVNTVYDAGEFFDPSGLEIEITYNNGTTETISYADHTQMFAFEPGLNTELSIDDTQVAVTYTDSNGKEYPFTVAITVYEPITAEHYEGIDDDTLGSAIWGLRDPNEDIFVPKPSSDETKSYTNLIVDALVKDPPRSAEEAEETIVNDSAFLQRVRESSSDQPVVTASSGDTQMFAVGDEVDVDKWGTSVNGKMKMYGCVKVLAYDSGEALESSIVNDIKNEISPLVGWNNEVEVEAGYKNSNTIYITAVRSGNQYYAILYMRRTRW